MLESNPIDPIKSNPINLEKKSDRFASKPSPRQPEIMDDHTYADRWRESQIEEPERWDGMS